MLGGEKFFAMKQTYKQFWISDSFYYFCLNENENEKMAIF
jgi:hypothetical protein